MSAFQYFMLLVMMGLLGATLEHFVFFLSGRAMSLRPFMVITLSAALVGVAVAFLVPAAVNVQLYEIIDGERTDLLTWVGLARTMLVSLVAAFLTAAVATGLHVRSRNRVTDAVSRDW